jgi:alpha-L-rhamnosidase
LTQNQLARNAFCLFRCLFPLFLLVASLAQIGLAQAPATKPVQLKCDSLVNPLGIDSKAPMLSWQLRDERFGARQTAYQIEVASSSALLGAGSRMCGTVAAWSPISRQV